MAAERAEDCVARSLKRREELERATAALVEAEVSCHHTTVMLGGKHNHRRWPWIRVCLPNGGQVTVDASGDEPQVLVSGSASVRFEPQEARPGWARPADEPVEWLNDPAETRT